MKKATKKESGDKKIAIMKAGLEVFSRHGFHGATMRQIAEMAGMAVGTIYIYFKRKDDILTELFKRDIEQHLDALFKKMEKLPAGEDLKVYYSERFTVIRQYFKLINLLCRESQNDERLSALLYKNIFEKVMTTLREYIAGRMANGDYRGVDLEIATIVLFSVSTHIVIWKETMFKELFSGISYEKFSEAIADLFAGGLIARGRDSDKSTGQEGMK